jgi:hypothetical protein
MTRSKLSLVLTLGLAMGCAGGDAAPAGEISSELTTAAKASLNRAVVACGDRGLPDCPLQEWMKATLQAYQRAGDFERLARSLQELESHAPAGFPGWAATAAAGVEAAQKHDAPALRLTCKNCHDTHRTRYRRERRAEPLF